MSHADGSNQKDRYHYHCNADHHSIYEQRAQMWILIAVAAPVDHGNSNNNDDEPACIPAQMLSQHGIGPFLPDQLKLPCLPCQLE